MRRVFIVLALLLLAGIAQAANNRFVITHSDNTPLGGTDNRNLYIADTDAAKPSSGLKKGDLCLALDSGKFYFADSTNRWRQVLQATSNQAIATTNEWRNDGGWTFNGTLTYGGVNAADVSYLRAPVAIEPLGGSQAQLDADSLTSSRNIQFPNAAGVLLLKDNIAVVTNKIIASTNRSISSTPVTLLMTDEVVWVDAASGSRDVYLPDASTLSGKRFSVKKMDSSSNDVNVLCASNDVEGDVAYVISTQYESHTFVSDGTDWWIVD